MSSYSFHIKKADHHNPAGTVDLHVHVYFNEKSGRRLLGRYRLPSLDPVFKSHPELNQGEISLLKQWLAQGEQIKKLTSFLKETLFDLHKLSQYVPQYSDIIKEGGDTYINVRIPVSQRII